MMDRMKRVVVTGLGALTPLGNDVPTTWANMVAGVSGCAPITAFDASKHKTQFACELKGWDVAAMFDRKEARKLDPYVQYTLWATHEAMQDAALDLEHEDRTRIGVIFGSGMGGLQTFSNEMVDYAHGDGTPRFSPFFIPKVILNMGAGQVSIRYGLQGPSFAVTSACASSSHAITQAFDQIRLGRADVMVTGGAEAPVTTGGVGGFNAMHALSTRNDSPASASRPFSASRDGFVIGEGAVTLVLEEYDHAVARGAHIYAELVGAGQTSDAYHMTAPDPESKGAAHVMQLAMLDAGIEPADIQHINTHGTSTPLGDIAELNAIKQVFGEHAYDISINSTKSMTGHLLGAAGALEAMACVLAIRDSIVPPTINHDPEDKDENIDYNLDLTFNQARRRDITYAMSNTFGFGGHNACLVFKKHNA